MWERSLPAGASPLVCVEEDRLPYHDEEDETRRSSFSLELEALRRVNQLPPPPPLASFSFADEGGARDGGGSDAMELARLSVLLVVWRCMADGGGGGGAGDRLAAMDRLSSDCCGAAGCWRRGGDGG